MFLIKKCISFIQVHAMDVDSGANGEVRYSIESHAEKVFIIDPITGVVTTNQTLDREMKDKYEFKIVAHDMAPIPQQR